MTTSHWLRPHSFSSVDFNADILIIGAGYVGLSTAYWLSEYRPDLKIVVLERSHCGAGASGRNAGFLTKGSAVFYRSLFEKWGLEKAQAIYTFAEESLQLVHQHILKSSPEIKFETASSMTLFQTEEDKKKWANDQFDPQQFHFEWKENSQLSAGLKSKFFGAFENHPEYKINPIQLLTSLRKCLEARKITIIENVSGYKLLPDGLVTEVNTIKAKQVILALNGYLPQFHSAFQDLVTPRRAQMLAVELEEDIEAPSLYYDPPERVYWRKTQEKLLLIGGKRLLDETGEVGNFEKVSPLIQDGLESYLRDQLHLKFKVLQRWSGTMGFTPHELPIITRAVEAPVETVVVGGFSGHGMGMGFRAAQETAQLVLGIKNKSFFDGFQTVNIKL